MTWLRLSAWVAALAAVGPAGCADTAECDPEQELVNGECLPRAAGTGGAAGAAQDAGGDSADGAASGDACVGPAVDFGASCAADGDCGCPASYCAIQPGGSTGYCTVTGCKEEPSLCTGGYTCLDLTAFGAPSFCAPP
ncbi:MAG: hypothetical protein IT376_09550 [Polyangiaceae bacterium]|nr:hypothetical protein [Polyangiaceae bacterium]